MKNWVFFLKFYFSVCCERREERRLDELEMDPSKVESIREHAFVPRTIFEKNVSPSLKKNLPEREWWSIQQGSRSYLGVMIYICMHAQHRFFEKYTSVSAQHHLPETGCNNYFLWLKGLLVTWTFCSSLTIRRYSEVLYTSNLHIQAIKKSCKLWRHSTWAPPYRRGWPKLWWMNWRG